MVQVHIHDEYDPNGRPGLVIHELPFENTGDKPPFSVVYYPIEGRDELFATITLDPQESRHIDFEDFDVGAILDHIEHNLQQLAVNKQKEIVFYLSAQSLAPEPVLLDRDYHKVYPYKSTMPGLPHYYQKVFEPNLVIA